MQSDRYDAIQQTQNSSASLTWSGGVLPRSQMRPQFRNDFSSRANERVSGFTLIHATASPPSFCLTASISPLAQLMGRDPAASSRPPSPSTPPPPPPTAQASTTSRRYWNGRLVLHFVKHLLFFLLLSVVWLIFLHMLWLYLRQVVNHEDRCHLDLKIHRKLHSKNLRFKKTANVCSSLCRICTCPYLWMMMTLWVNRCKSTSCSTASLSCRWPLTPAALRCSQCRQFSSRAIHCLCNTLANP